MATPLKKSSKSAKEEEHRGIPPGWSVAKLVDRTENLPIRMLARDENETQGQMRRLDENRVQMLMQEFEAGTPRKIDLTVWFEQSM